MQQISVSLVTGFLGSGKTTMISRLLVEPELAGTVVLVNEAAPLGFDDALLKKSAGEVLLLANGCVCCSINDDLCFAMRNLLRRRRAGELSTLSHVMIETTGIADPIPILRSIAADPVLADFYALDRVVVTVDAAYGLSQLKVHPEAAAQISVADFISITKDTKLSAAARQALADRLSRINPAADIADSDQPVTGKRLMARTRISSLRGANTGRSEIRAETGQTSSVGHGLSIASLVAEERVDWERVVSWVESLGARLGEGLLRIKGILALRDGASPVFINGVQDTFYAPILLPEALGFGEKSKFVVIARGVDPGSITQSFQAAVLA
jgi:G3E family GTPase